MKTLTNSAKRTDLSWSAGKTALLLDITARRLQQLVKQGTIPKLPNHRLNPFDAANAYVRYLRDLAHQPDMSRADYEESRRRKAQADAELAEQKSADYNKTHIPLSDVRFMQKTVAAHVFRFINDFQLPFPKEVEAGHRYVRAQINAMRDMNAPTDLIKKWERDLSKRETALRSAIREGTITESFVTTPLAIKEAVAWEPEG
jgi:hypothetical protein